MSVECVIVVRGVRTASLCDCLIGVVSPSVCSRSPLSLSCISVSLMCSLQTGQQPCVPITCAVQLSGWHVFSAQYTLPSEQPHCTHWLGRRAGKSAAPPGKSAPCWCVAPWYWHARPFARPPSSLRGSSDSGHAGQHCWGTLTGFSHKSCGHRTRAHCTFPLLEQAQRMQCSSPRGGRNGCHVSPGLYLWS